MDFLFSSIHLFLHPLRYTEPASSSFGHHHRRFRNETFQAGCHRSSQGVDCCLAWVILFACRSNLHPLWQCRGGRSYRLISGVSGKFQASFIWSLQLKCFWLHKDSPWKCNYASGPMSCTHACLFMSLCTRVPQVSYNHQTLLSQCNTGCSCSLKQWDPVCAYNGMTYASPCLAGCQTSTGTGKEMVR